MLCCVRAKIKKLINLFMQQKKQQRAFFYPARLTIVIPLQLISFWQRALAVIIQYSTIVSRFCFYFNHILLIFIRHSLQWILNDELFVLAVAISFDELSRNWVFEWKMLREKSQLILIKKLPILFLNSQNFPFKKILKFS